jgi:hypothetical protein
MQYGNEYCEIELDKILAEDPLAPEKILKLLISAVRRARANMSCRFATAKSPMCTCTTSP